MVFPTTTSALAATSQPSNWEMPQSFSTAFSTIYTGFTSVWHATHRLIGSSNPTPPKNVEIPVPSGIGQQSSPKLRRRKRMQNTRPPVATVVRRFQRLNNTSKQFSIPEKPIFRQRMLEREGALLDLERVCPPRLGRVGLRREESFVLVDHGDHFRMVKPMYAKTHYQWLPGNFVSIAPYHAFGPDIEQEMLREILCINAVGMAPRTTNSRKRVRFADEDEDDNHDDRLPISKKARRS